MVIGTIMLLEPIGSLVCGDLLQLDDKQSVNLETKKHIIAATYTCLPVHADKFDKNCDKKDVKWSSWQSYPTYNPCMLHCSRNTWAPNKLGLLLPNRPVSKSLVKQPTIWKLIERT